MPLASCSRSEADLEARRESSRTKKQSHAKVSPAMSKSGPSWLRDLCKNLCILAKHRRNLAQKEVVAAQDSNYRLTDLFMHFQTTNASGRDLYRFVGFTCPSARNMHTTRASVRTSAAGLVN